MSTASHPVRRAAVAGTWYPDDPGELLAEVDRYLDDVAELADLNVTALIAPHAGLVYSGPTAAYAYAAVRRQTYAVAVLVGPSHFVGFDGVSVYGRGAWETPLGRAGVQADLAARLQSASSLIREYPRAHQREHCLELQLPFLQRVMPQAAILPLVIGYQHRATILELSDVLAEVLGDTKALLVASTDLSHYFDAAQASRLDRRTATYISAFDWAGLLHEFEQYPEEERGRHVACGGAAAISVMRTAQLRGATVARVLKQSDSGEIFGHRERVVGYLSAVFGTARS